MMKVSVEFYKNLDPESILFNKLKALKSEYPTSYWIGMRAGFGAEQLSWKEAARLAALIAATVYKTNSASVFSDMRLMLQKDGP
jgi:hypothetical protein